METRQAASLSYLRSDRLEAYPTLASERLLAEIKQ
jgi:hypothetical protein